MCLFTKSRWKVEAAMMNLHDGHRQTESMGMEVRNTCHN